MRVKYTESTEYKALNRLNAIRGSVVLREDLNGIGTYRQMSRVLNKFVAEKKLVKISAGVYAKAYTSKYTDIPLIKDGADAAFREALQRLNIAFEPGSTERSYNAKKSTQVPAQNVVRLKSRCRRRIGYGNSYLVFEKNINAK